MQNLYVEPEGAIVVEPEQPENKIEKNEENRAEPKQAMNEEQKELKGT